MDIVLFIGIWIVCLPLIIIGLVFAYYERQNEKNSE